jgi:hypothetical protein
MHVGRGVRIAPLTLSTRLGIATPMFRAGPPRRVTVRLVFRDVNAFHVMGGVLAVWALVVSFLGVTRENFPATRGAERVVAAISVALVAAAIASALITGANEAEEKEHEEAAEEAALVLGR